MAYYLWLCISWNNTDKELYMQLQPSCSSASLAIYQIAQLIDYSAMTRRNLSLKAEKLLQQSRSSLILRLLIRGEKEKIRCSSSCWIFFTPQSSKKEPVITRSLNARFHYTLVLVMTTTEAGAKIQLSSLMCLQSMWAHAYK